MLVTRNDLPLIYAIMALLPMAVGIVLLLVGRFLPRRGTWLSVWSSFVVLAAASLLLWGTVQMCIDQEPCFRTYSPPFLSGWEAIVRIDILIDSAALAFACVLAGCLWVSSIASGALCDKQAHCRLLALSSIALSVALWLLVSDNMVMLAALWSLLGLIAYFMLDIGSKETGSLRSARTFLVMVGAGNACMLIGTALLAAGAGRVDAQSLVSAFESTTAIHRHRYAIEVLLTLGFVLNLAIFPVRAWFVATSGGTFLGRLTSSILMGAVGVFMLARFHFLFSQKLLIVLGLLAILSALVTGLTAWVSGSASRAVACVLLAHLGLVVAMIAFGGPRHGLSHTWVWCIFGTLLLIWSSSFECRAGTADLQRLGGLKAYMPLTFWTGFCGICAGAFLPPFAGFWSGSGLVEWLFSFGLDRQAQTMLPALWYADFVIPLAVVLVIVTVSFALFRLAFRVFIRPAGDTTILESAQELPVEVILGAMILAVFSLVGAEILPARYAWLKTEHVVRARDDRLLVEPTAESVPREIPEKQREEDDYEEEEATEPEEPPVVENIGLSRRNVALVLAASASLWGLLAALLAYWPRWSLRRRVKIFDPVWASERVGFLRKLLD